MTILSLLLVLAPLCAAQPASPPQSDYALPPPPAVSTATRLDFEADHVDYDASSATMRLKGRVVVKESTRTIKADELSMDTRSRTGRAQGFLLVEDGGSAVAAEDGGFFDFEQKTGELHKASAGHGVWRVHAKEAKLGAHKKLDYLSADFTSCEFRPPHYHFHATRLTIVPKKYMLARNTSFWIGPVPLFYFPIFWKSLNPEHAVPIRFQPGYDRRNGPFVKGTMFRSIDRYTYDKIYLDYYGTQGPGFGNELQRRRGDDDRAALFGYYIKEHPNGEHRWAVAGDVYRVIASSLSMQGRLQLQSDARFNNDYARSSVLRVTPELFNSGAFVWRQKKYWLRLAYNRHEVASADQIHFDKTDEDYPRLDLQTTQLKLGPLPWLHTFTGFADNNFAQGRPFLQRSVGGAWEGTQVYPLGKGFSLVPKLGYSEVWYDKFEEQTTATSSTTFQDVFVGHYKTQGDLRWKTPLGDWDLIHDYVRRLKPGAMADDASALDHGVETNLLTLRDLYHPVRGLFVRVYSGYDFRIFRDRTLGFHDRLQPAVGEITYAPRPTLNWTLRDDYRIGEGNRSLLGSFLYGHEDLSFAQVSAGYNQGQAQRYEGDLNFALTNASATWRVGGILRNEVFTPGGAHRLSLDRVHSFEKEISIAHAWHDFFTRVLVRFRPGGVREFTAKVTLKFGPGGGSRDSQPRRDWESEWFPERSAGVYDRP